MSDQPRQRDSWPSRVLIGTYLVLVVVTGYFGWRQFYPEITGPELVYRALAMMVLSWEVGYDVHHIPFLLNVSRFLALGAAFGAAGAILAQLLRSRHRLELAKRAKRHVVILGEGPEVLRLAQNYRRQWGGRRRVVAVGDHPEELGTQLASRGVIVLRAPSDTVLSEIVRQAQDVVVAGSCDRESARLATRVEACAGGSRYPTTVLFYGRSVTQQWNRGSNVTALSRNTQVAIATLRESPPALDDKACPPPIVVGSDEMATEIARRMVIGWQQLGERMTVHCVGSKDSWVNDAREGLTDRGDFLFTRVSLSPDAVARVSRELTAAWQAPRADRFAQTGPTIFVALTDATQGFPIAARLAEVVPGSRVTALVDDPATWSRQVARMDSAARPRLRSASELLSDPAVLALTPGQLLVEELLWDASRWPAEIPTLFGELVHDGSGTIPPDAQTTSTQDAIQAIATAAKSILAAGKIDVCGVHDEASEAIWSSPEELVAMRDAILSSLPASDNPDQPQRALELATRLPTLVARAGWTPHRLPGATNLLTVDELHRLAKLNHASYQRVSGQTGNATGSDNAAKGWDELSAFEQESNRAQAVDVPAKLAAAGLTWRRSASPASYEFEPETLERLAELEHRRWEHHQRRNGRPGHKWAVPWSELSDGVKDFDRAAVRSIPPSLAELGVEIAPVT